MAIEYRRTRQLRLLFSIYCVPIILALALLSTTVFAVPTQYSLSVSSVAQKIWYNNPSWVRCANCPTNYIGCNWCWAATYTSGINYKKQTNWPIWDIVETKQGTSLIRCEGATTSTLPSLLNSTYGINSVFYNYKPSTSTITTNIYSSHNPLYSSNGSHATLVYGYYDDGSNFYIEYMDPWYPGFYEVDYSVWGSVKFIKIAT